MNVGKTLFAQVMEYIPWKTFGRIIDRQGGDGGVRTLDCADLFCVMTRYDGSDRSMSIARAS